MALKWGTMRAGAALVVHLPSPVLSLNTRNRIAGWWLLLVTALQIVGNVTRNR
jgi:hypothetical protein